MMVRRAGSMWGLLLPLILGLSQTKAQQSSPSRPVFSCGGDLVAESGFVGSEGFPSFYKPNSKCAWRITVPEGNVVSLSFRIFDLEADSQCRYDYVDVYNGDSNLVQKLGRFCGTFRPGTLISTSNTMMLEMVTDEASQSTGFMALFSGTKPFSNDQQCGEKMTEAKGELKSPNWPDRKYPPGTSCSWLIAVEPDRVIQVKFDKFLLESDSYCRFDYVAFYNGGEKNESQLIGRFCGDRAPDPIISNGNELLVQFVSDLSVTSDGFFASYTSIPRGSQLSTVESGAHTGAVPSAPEEKPAKPEAPATTAQTTTTEYTTTKAVTQNSACPKVCRRAGTIKTSFCSSEFVLTGKVASVTPGPQGSINLNVSLIKAHKAGRLTITQVGETRSVMLVSQCKRCPSLRRGLSYIIMGQVDEDGRGILVPTAFTAPYKVLYDRLLRHIKKQPC